MTNDQIREVFLANGFTIKPGEADLKPYVYAAARALLEAALKPGEPVAFVDRAHLKELQSANGMRVWAEGPEMCTPACDCEVPTHLVAVYTAAPPAQTPPKDDFIHKRAQFEAEWSKVRELQRQCKEFIEKQKTPPPRLTEQELACIFGGYVPSPSLIEMRILETAVRKQAGWPG